MSKANKQTEGQPAPVKPAQAELDYIGNAFDGATGAGVRARRKSAAELCEGRTIWNSDGTNGPCLICGPDKPAVKPAAVKVPQIEALPGCSPLGIKPAGKRARRRARYGQPAAGQVSGASARVKLAKWAPAVRVYRLAYPCHIYFDVKARDYATARVKAAEFLDGIAAGLAQDLDEEGVMVYPKVGSEGTAEPEFITLEDITLPE